MSEVIEGARDYSRGEWQPAERPGPAPLFVWPPRALQTLKFITGNPGYLFPWNVMFGLIAIGTWLYTPPELSQMAEFRVGCYAGLGVRVSRVMTDNGSCYTSRAFAKACKDLELKHIRTKPYTPKTNGKAERFIQTALREWAYARAYRTSAQRAEYLPIWSHMYNWHRPLAD